MLSPQRRYAISLLCASLLMLLTSLSHATFVGTIRATEIIKNAVGIRTKHKIEYHIDEHSIERVRHHSRGFKDGYRGVKIVPKENLVYIYWKEATLGAYTKMTLSQYRNYRDGVLHNRDQVKHKAFGASYYLKFVDWHENEHAQTQNRHTTFKGYPCHQYTHQQQKGSENITLRYCDNLVPAQWLPYTEFYWREMALGFPIEFKFKHKKDALRDSDNRAFRAFGKLKDSVKKTKRLIKRDFDYHYRVFDIQPRKPRKHLPKPPLDLEHFTFAPTLKALRKLVDSELERIEAKKRAEERKRREDNKDGPDSPSVWNIIF